MSRPGISTEITGPSQKIAATNKTCDGGIDSFPLSLRLDIRQRSHPPKIRYLKEQFNRLTTPG